MDVVLYDPDPPSATKRVDSWELRAEYHTTSRIAPPGLFLAEKKHLAQRAAWIQWMVNAGL